jgi:hypothetical protein
MGIGTGFAKLAFELMRKAGQDLRVSRAGKMLEAQGQPRTKAYVPGLGGRHKEMGTMEGSLRDQQFATLHTTPNPRAGPGPWPWPRPSSPSAAFP